MVITGPAICYARGATNSFAEIIGDFLALSQNQSTKLRRSHMQPRSTTDEGLPQPSQLVRPAGLRRASRCDLWRAQYLRPLCLPAASLFSTCGSGPLANATQAVRFGRGVSCRARALLQGPSRATLLAFLQPLYRPTRDCGR